MFERILVALDNSPSNVSVFETALSLAKWANARLMLAHVQPCEDMNEGMSIAESSTPFSSIGQQACEVQGLRMLREFHAIAATAGVGSDLAQPLASPGQQICELAIGWGADLVVVGRRGLSAADADLQGSVSQYVTHHAACPVLIVQHQHLPHSSPLAERELSRVAVAR